MKIRKHRIYLTDTELSHTRDITATELSCGHSVLPRLKKAKYMEHVRCEVCRKNVLVIADTVYSSPQTILKGQS